MNKVGLPLYRHRLSDQDFQSHLERCRQLLARRAYTSCAPGFVRWASEHYRRHYEGGVLSWSFLTDALGQEVSQAELREMTREGLRQHGRERLLKSSTGTQYLSSLAAEGGIPVHLLAQEGGYRQSLLGLVADLDRFGAACPYEEALAFARNRADRLPMGYRRPEFLEVFIEFAREISALRQAAPKGLASQEIEAWLDLARPGWTEALVLQLDGQAARSLLSQAIGQNRGAGATSAPIQRQMKWVREDGWAGHAVVERAVRLPGHLLPFDRDNGRRIRLGVTGKASDVIPDLMFALEPNDHGKEWVCKRISGQRTASFKYPLDASIEIIAMADGRYMDQVDLPGAGGIPLDVPSLWTVEETNELGHPVRLSHAGNANIKTTDPVLWLWLPNGMTPNADEGVDLVSGSSAFGGQLWQVRGTGRLRTRDWNAKIQTGGEISDRDEIVAFGPLSRQIRDTSGQPVHVGLPQVLAREAGKSFRAPSPKDLRYRAKGDRIWTRKPPSDDFMGHLEIAIAQDNNIGMRVRVQVMPPRARVVMKGQTVVQLSGFPPGGLVRLGSLEPVRFGRDGQCSFDLGAMVAKFQQLPLHLTQSGDQPLSWSVELSRPCPGFAWLDGALLTAACEITPDAIPRLKFSSADGRMSMLALKAVENGVKTAEMVLNVPTTVPMTAFRNLVNGFLSFGTADCRVQLRAFCGPDTSPRLTLRRYAEAARIYEDALVICDEKGEVLKSAEPLSAEVIDLDSPQRRHSLSGSETSGLSERLGPGRWFFVARSGQRLLRPPPPLVIAGPEVMAEVSEEMRAASLHPRQLDRVHAFQEVLNSNLGRDIQIVGDTVDFLFAHGLSPSVLDPVHALRNLPVQSVRLLLSSAPDGLLDRLSLDIHGGADWVTIAPQHWGKAILREITQIEHAYERIPSLAAEARKLAQDALRLRVRDIVAQRTDLTAHLALALLDNQICGPDQLAEWLGSVPAAFNNPELGMIRIAEDAIRRHGHTSVSLHGISAPITPKKYDQFDPSMRPLVDAPLMIACIAHGLRARPKPAEKLALLKARYLDPGFFDEAIPAAMAFINMKNLAVTSEMDKTA